jgi:hypothetical protein
MPRDVDLKIGETEIQNGPLVANADFWSPTSGDLSNSPQRSGRLHYTILRKSSGNLQEDSQEIQHRLQACHLVYG